MIVTRFAPSPTGELHLGHAASAFYAYERAMEAGGRFLLRIEDIDPVRCDPVFIDRIYEDLAWLGLNWEKPVRLQSQHMADYERALAKLRETGLLYPCYCTRKEVMAEALSSSHAPHQTVCDLRPCYAGTCRNLSDGQRQELAKTRKPVWRLDVQKAIAQTGPLHWRDIITGEDVPVKPESFGDIVLARKDIPTSYHLSVTVDDALQEVTLVTRGQDLYPFTSVHRLLQALLGLPTPDYSHHPLLLDSSGNRFSKRDKSIALRALREDGWTRDHIFRLIHASA